jgi:hypothetical protein
MSIFRDLDGNEWPVQLDAFAIEEVKCETGIDLADISAGGWLAIATDAAAVGRVLAVLCGEDVRTRKMTSRAFARLVRGDAIPRGRQTLLDEGADFFPASEWSEMQSSLTKRRSSKTQTDQLNLIGLDNATKILPLAEAFMRLDAMTQQQLVDEARASTDSPTSADAASASGPENTPPTSATVSPANAESPPADSR